MATGLAFQNDMVQSVISQAEQLREMIAVIDSKLGVEGSSRAKLLDGLADTVAESHSSTADQLKDVVNSEHGDTRVAIVALLRRVLREFDPEVKKYVEANLPKDEKPQESEVVVALKEERKPLVEGYKASRKLIELAAADRFPEFPEIQHLRGGTGQSGRRGPRLANKFVFTVDGKEISGHRLSDVGLAADTNAGDVRVAIQASNAGAKEDSWWASPPTTFEFDINGKHVVGTQVASTNGSVAELDEDDDEVSTADVFGSLDEDDDI